MFGGFKGAEHGYSEVFFISFHLKTYSSVELKVVLEKKPQKHVLVHDMAMRQLYAFKYVCLQLLDKLFPSH